MDALQQLIRKRTAYIVRNGQLSESDAYKIVASIGTPPPEPNTTLDIKAHSISKDEQKLFSGNFINSINDVADYLYSSSHCQ